MPKAAIPLNDKRIKALKPKAKRYLIADGGGLVLEVMTSGSMRLDGQFPSLLSGLRCSSGQNCLPVSNFICFESK